MNAAAPIAALAILAAACDRSASKPIVIAIDPPAAPSAASPNLIARGDSVLLTWLEPIDATRVSHRLQFAELVRGSWTAPTTISEGASIFANWADVPSVARQDDGTLVAHWAEKSAAKPYAYDVVLARSTDGGVTWKRIGKPHADATTTEHGFVSLVPDGDATLALWLDGRAMAGDADGAMTLRSARIGETIGDETVVDDRVCDCCSTSAAMTSEGPVVVYRDRSTDELRDPWFSRRLASAWSAPKPVHTDGWQITGCPVNGPTIVASGREVIVAWFTLADQRPSVRVAFSADAGATFESPIEIDAPREARAPLGRVDVVIDRPGEAIVSWMVSERDEARVLLRRVTRDGRHGAELVVATTSAARDSGFPRMDMVGPDLVIAWTDARAAKLRVTRIARSAVPSAL